MSAYHARMDILVILILVLILVLMWRGPKTLPRIGQMLGRGVKQARAEAADITSNIGKSDEPKV